MMGISEIGDLIKSIIYDYSRRLEKQELELYQFKMMLLDKGIISKEELDSYFSDEALKTLLDRVEKEL